MPTSKWVYNFHFEIISQWNRVWVNKLEVKFRLKVISSAQLIALLIRIKNSLRPQISVSLKFKLPIISARDTNRVVETGENKSRWLVCSNFLFDLIMKTPSRNGQIKGAHPNINKIKGKKNNITTFANVNTRSKRSTKMGDPIAFRWMPPNKSMIRTTNAERLKLSLNKSDDNRNARPLYESKYATPIVFDSPFGEDPLNSYLPV